MKLIDLIPHSPNRISRHDLALKADMTDRQMRLEIEQLRFSDPQGAYICSDLSGGYYIGTFQEVKDYLRTENARANSLKARTRRQLMRVKAVYKQEGLFA